ncbi:growth arrest and DNA damage-inducible protein GADD45 gamma-like [Elysia marginata]|uniref:Growth arrest and DNA damage-inducible protein GADD45 gamma-like n=1 Tax=Elysia marginata TaxID=1093978 RepID=A0AAV4JRX3_9GAST|nr:growth arrest and DNA damage-inducible protein GADD45 gamma-like [Elysia marginata]
MPLPETMGPENEIDPRCLKAVGLTLLKCIKQAHRKGHLICGMTACAELLQKDPETVMLCVLPEDSCNVAANIHQMLIEAFCRENFIPMMKTSEPQKMNSLINQLKGGNEIDATCILLQNAKLGPSKQDEALCQFYNDMMASPQPMPYLTLPD